MLGFFSLASTMVLMAITLLIQVQMGWNFACNLSFTQILHRWCSGIMPWPSDRDRSHFHSVWPPARTESLCHIGFLLVCLFVCVFAKCDKIVPNFKVELRWLPLTESTQFSMSAPLGALVLLVASDVTCRRGSVSVEQLEQFRNKVQLRWLPLTESTQIFLCDSVCVSSNRKLKIENRKS